MSSKSNEKDVFTVLVTGANSGLGFALCCRLIDEFLYTRPQTQHLHLLFSTRDGKKGDDTKKRLQEHLAKFSRTANGTTLGISQLLDARIHLENVLVDLLKLTTVKSLAEQLLRRGQRLDAVVWNAGIPGWLGLNWPKAIWSVATDTVHATTYPEYMRPDLGAIAKPQLDGKKAGGSPEPTLGQVFTANVFGHYMLTHWLSPLMTRDTRIVWTSSISALPNSFSLDDIQGLKTPAAYECSKRLTDFLVLTSELPSAKPFMQSFLPTSKPDSTPKMYVTHPGVIGTSIAGLNAVMEFFMFLTFVFARLFGSPWHAAEPYKGAVSAVFAVLSTQLPDLEQRDGKGKWGSAVGVSGDERVARTEVDGWGFSGRVGSVPDGSVVGLRGRWRGLKQVTDESRREFEETGREVWKAMEQMREEWEARLGPLDQGVAK
ncbi:unnamed protein product [Zymoseptoria tritici ST99CH_1E4]|uniref:3-keto-steroid reductase n=1 Tax=Zymoseptoria tritici ST99CH_1E4 TaxID=1276532 RepID=A0A2H1G587_ZYMTR|nr:unnamed protein product [Zymoseptoria tritici ST99CH_1E4]